MKITNEKLINADTKYWKSCVFHLLSFYLAATSNCGQFTENTPPTETKKHIVSVGIKFLVVKSKNKKNKNKNTCKCVKVN